MYMISHTVTCICCNSCNFSNNIHAHRNTLRCNELQMVITSQKPNCKANCKLAHFFILFGHAIQWTHGAYELHTSFWSFLHNNSNHHNKTKIYVYQKPPLKLFHQPSWYGIGTQIICFLWYDSHMHSHLVFFCKPLHWLLDFGGQCSIHHTSCP